MADKSIELNSKVEQRIVMSQQESLIIGEKNKNYSLDEILNKTILGDCLKV